MKKKSVQKGEIIQSQGALNTKMYYVEKGLLRSYIIDKTGKEHIYMFSPESWYIGDTNPPEEPCQLFIDALEPSIVYEIDKAEALDKQEKIVLVRRISQMQKRILLMLGSSLIERYEYFVKLYPNISNRVPQKMIASFLGSTPEALSKVKGDRTKKS